MEKTLDNMNNASSADDVEVPQNSQNLAKRRNQTATRAATNNLNSSSAKGGAPSQRAARISMSTKMQRNANTNKLKKRKHGIATLVIGISLIVLLTLLLGAYFIGGDYAFKLAIGSTYTAEAARTEDSLRKIYPFPDNDISWVNSATESGLLTDANITSYDKLSLHAKVYKSEVTTNNWAIVLHGYRGNWSEMALPAQKSHEQGINCLIPDLRGQGESEGSFIGLGYFDRLDVLKWIEYIINLNSNAKIILYGLSMGGATVLMTTGEKLPENVVCAIEDCAYSNVFTEFNHVASNVLNLPFSNISMFAIDGAAKRKTGASLKEMDVTKFLAKSTTPTLFIHGSGDSFVPFAMLNTLYTANTSIYRERLVIDGAEHAMASTVNPGLYYSTVFQFINKFI